MTPGNREALAHIAQRVEERSCEDYVEVGDMLALASDVVQFSIRVHTIELRDKLARVVLVIQYGCKVDNGGVRRHATARAAKMLQELAEEQA